ncbi:MAG: rRNA methyltransferase [Flavobacteriales bacterium CG18_big_fil_WC_8_21_14_2_50_32_9]|nr:RNA methyltransferase [Flavobacteriales bacterium]PIQ16220.1 MAG: rRNA methyltransferase [Flavobacteriales bacterium CG18_big_fil_WC_8_21_14_2_50_32_9]PIZ06290.1 MAG: rRNA methyltransferase [Flavobacteriales bacterium CG_4_10_14_0_8_um_filter_32_5]PJC62440.1 MAG: rRNA methyltransferase [Flavobacteriales bacterium CG_4_9_14_0_2_um_filter_32_27]
MTYEKKLLEHLLTFISENKNELFLKIINERTQHCTVILEDIFQPQNASAVLRSCDVFGIQDVHIIENRNTYNVNPKVVQGASKWININKYNEFENNTLSCINALKNKGYKIYATSPHAINYSIQDIPINNKFALLFGTEKEGLSEIALSNADELVKIPMVGFTESLNISVSAAICLYEVTKRLHESTIDWQLTEEEKITQLIQWTKKVIKRGEAIERAFLKTL